MLWSLLLYVIVVEVITDELQEVRELLYTNNMILRSEESVWEDSKIKGAMADPGLPGMCPCMCMHECVYVIEWRNSIAHCVPYREYRCR